MKRSLRLLGSLSIASLVLSSQILPPPPPVLAQAARVCATPGRDGNPGALTGVVNTYYPGIASVAAGATTISVGAPTGGAPIQAGDLLLVIQMQGATIDASNTDAYGNGVGGDVPVPVAQPVVSPNGQSPIGASGFLTAIAGNYEFVVATGPVAGGVLPIRAAGAGSGLLNSYVNAPASAAQGQQTYQVVRVPQYATATLGAPTALPWNGAIGGILAFDVVGNLNLAGTATVTGQGFRGGGGRQAGGDPAAPALNNTDFVTLSARTPNGSKGEGIAGTPRLILNPATNTVIDTGVEGYPNGSFGRGAPGNAGGGSTDGDPTGLLGAPAFGGNEENSGGGGGSNGARGGIGGRSWRSQLPVGGFGGSPFPASTSRLVMGGGGGAGTSNNGTGAPGAGVASSGSAGGGMVFIRTGSVSGAGTINANGSPANNTVQNDGGGGGGAGGSVLFSSLSGSTAGLTINIQGGRGGDANVAVIDAHGPGGGGSGGVAVITPGATISGTGGPGGLTGSAPGFPPTLLNGATAGDDVVIPLPLTTVPGANSGAECLLPQQADLSLRKTVNSSLVTVGQNVTYTLTLSNAGPANATGVAVTDRLPAGLTFVSATPSQGTYAPGTGVWTVGNVAVNGSATLQVTATVTTTNPITNTAQVTASDQPDPDSTPNNNNGNEDDLATASIGGPSFRLVKRITRVSRAGVITNFNTFVDDPADVNDNAPGWAQLSPVGILNTDPANPLQSGDQVEYTVYFLSDGNNPITAANVCDPIPGGTTFVANTLQIQRPLESLIAGGAFFPPLAPLPPNNSCTSQTNTNGAAIFDIGNVSNTTGSNVGFVRFRVRIN